MFAKTNRLKNSYVAYMQRTLSTDYLQFEIQELKRKKIFNPVKGDVSDSHLNAGGGGFDHPLEINEGAP